MKEIFGTLKNCPLWASVRLSRVSVRTGFPVSTWIEGFHACCYEFTYASLLSKHFDMRPFWYFRREIWRWSPCWVWRRGEQESGSRKSYAPLGLSIILLTQVRYGPSTKLVVMDFDLWIISLLMPGTMLSVLFWAALFLNDSQGTKNLTEQWLVFMPLA